MPQVPKTLRHDDLRFADFTVDFRAGKLCRNGVEVRLQDQPFQILAQLVQRAGEVVTRDELRRHVWSSDTFVDFDNSLNTAINKIRETLGDSAEAPRFIETLPRRGYRFIAPIESGRAVVFAEPNVGTHFTRRGILILVGLFAVPLGAVLYLVLQRPRTIDSIAVLPLVNAASDANANYLSEGITDGLINDLSQLPNLTVKSERSVSRYKGRDVDLQLVGRELGVRAVLVGKLVQYGDALSISVELVDPRDDSHIWGEHYTRKLADIAGLQEAISKDIAEKVRPKLSGEQKTHLGTPHTQNAEAYQLYLKGRFYWNKRTAEGMNQGLTYFEEALQKDSGYALAYSGLADSYNMLGIWGFVSPEEAGTKAKEAALKAVELDPLSPESHASLAFVKCHHDWDWSGGEKEIKEALRLNPSYDTAYRWYADAVLAATGRSEEAIAATRRAEALDPTSLINSAGVGLELCRARRYDEALAQLRKTLEMEANYFPTHKYLAMAYLGKSMPEQAIQEAQRAAALSTNSAMADLAISYAALGNTKKARSILRSLEIASKSRYVSSFEIAAIFANLKDTDRAFEFLHKAYEERNYDLPYLSVDSRFDRLRSDPRYADLLRGMGLPQ